MGHKRSVITLIAGAAVLVLGAGCSGSGLWKGKGDPGWKVPAGIPSAPMSSSLSPDGSGVMQAGAITGPTSALAANLPPSLQWLSGKSEKAARNSATSIAVAWRNRIDHLPDPARDGAMGPGLAGQIFLFGPRDQPALADGTLTVDLYDETPRPAGFPPNKPERWQFKKDVLRNLRTMDERFGPSYVVFLPWPTYRPDVTRVRIRARFDPEQGSFPLYAEETRLTIDTSTMGGRDIGATSTHAFSAVQPASGFPTPGGPPSGPGPGMGVFTIQKPGTQPATTPSVPPPSHVNAYTIGTLGGSPRTPITPAAPMGLAAPATHPSPDSFAPMAPIGPIAPTRP